MSDYLIHFNKNHDKLGRFAIGDGDGKPNKINKYQYADGTLTPVGKQRWAYNYAKDVKKAKRRGEDTTKVTTEIDTDKWRKQDILYQGKNILSALWFIQVANYGGVWFRTGRKKYSEQSIDELLKTHSGNSVYAEGKDFAEKFINDLDSVAPDQKESKNYFASRSRKPKEAIS